MSKYTTQVRYICEQYAGLDESVGFDDIDSVLDNSVDKVFSFDFPIFDESYREVLERKILMHYYTREIGFETVGLWKLKLCSKLNEIMPYYNKLYNSELIEFNPMYDVDLTRSHQRINTDKTDGTSESSSSSEGEYSNSGSNENTGWNLFQDTPQNTLQDVDEMNYLSNATKTTDSGESSSEGSNSNSTSGSSEFENNYKGIEDYSEKVLGSSGGMNYSDRLKKFRETFLNIDMKVINDLSDLFMYLW